VKTETLTFCVINATEDVVHPNALLAKSSLHLIERYSTILNQRVREYLI
jgi:hypothetical protein